MIKQLRIVFSLIVCFVLIGALGSAPKALALTSNPQQPHEYLSANGDTVTVKAADDTSASAQPYTVEQRRNAKTLDLALKASDLGASVGGYSSGTPGFKAGALPDPAATSKAKALHPDAWAAQDNRQALDQPTRLTPSMNTFGTKNIFTGYLGNYFSPFWLYYPYSTAGKLYFADPFGNLYTCSASSIGEYTIVTAAHCVYDTDNNFWYHGWQFVPAEMDLYEPFGYFNFSNATVLAKWMGAKKSSSGMRYDVAVLQMYDAPGYYTGWLGYAWNWSTKLDLHAIGYPSNITGTYYTYICTAETAAKSSDVLGMGCDMTYGSSGGPWILGFLPYQGDYPYTVYGNYVDAVVSGGVVGIPTFYGPRFSTNNIIPLCIATGCP